MPHKGLPRCEECLLTDWEPVKFGERSVTIRCRVCGVIKRSRSVGGIRKMREVARIIEMIGRKNK